jgi:hypothetical protein
MAGAEQICDQAKSLDQLSRARNPARMGDELVHRRGVDEPAPDHLPAPRLDCGDRWPPRIQFDGIERPGVVIEPFAGLGTGWVEPSPPTRVEQSRAVDVQGKRPSRLDAQLRKPAPHARGACARRVRRSPSVALGVGFAFGEPLFPAQNRRFRMCCPWGATNRRGAFRDDIAQCV